MDADQGLTTILQSIKERNTKSREEAANMTGRLISTILAPSNDKFEQFNAELETKFRELLQEQGESSDSSGTDSGSGHAEEVINEQPQQ